MRLHDYEVQVSRRDNIQKVQDIARQIDLLISNSLLRVQSYEEYLGPRNVDYNREASFIHQALSYTLFQRLSIFRMSHSQRREPTIRRIARIEVKGTTLPKVQSTLMHSQVLIQLIQKMDKTKDYQQSAFFNLNNSSIFAVILHSKFHRNVYFVFLTPIERVFEPVTLLPTETIYLTEPNSNRSWMISGQENAPQLKITPVESEINLTQGKWVIPFDKEMSQSGLRLKFDFLYSSSNEDVSTSYMALFLCLAITLVVSLLFWLMVSQNKRAARLVVQRTHDLERAHHLTQEALMFKSRFIGNISHEIRTPLNMILGMVELCEERDVDGKIQEYLRNMRASGNHLLEMIEDLLDLAKIETSDLHFQYKPINVVQFFDEIGRIVGQECDKKCLRMYLSYDPLLPSTIKCDPSRLRQVLLNLLKNSCKYTNKGFVRLKVQSRDLPESGKKRFTFEVRDSGVGIPKEKIAHIFDAFVQVENSHALSEGGVGLGLSIVKDIVKKMNGSVHVESSMNVGSTFTVDLDLEVLDPTPWISRYRHPSAKKQTLYLALTDHRNADLISGIAPLVDLHVETVPLSQLNSFAQNYHKNANSWVLIEPFSALEPNHPLFEKLDPARTLLIGDRPALKERYKNLHMEALNGSPVIISELLSAMGFSSRKKPRLVEPLSVDTPPPPVRYLSTQKNLSIIVADDDDGNRELVRAYLDNTAWKIDFTMNGQEAWDRYLQTGADLMIVDGRMPVMDGFTLIEKVRSHEKEHQLPPCPVILVTADALEQTEKKAKSFSSVTYMTKPLRKAKLLDAIEQTQTPTAPVAES